MLMYYQERFEAGEAGWVLMRMRESFTLVFSAREDAHFKILEFGREIRSKFDVDNLHMTDRHGHDLSEKVITVVKQLASSVSSTHAQMADMAERQGRLETKFDQILALLSRVPIAPATTPQPPPLINQPPPPATPRASAASSSAATAPAELPPVTFALPDPPTMAAMASPVRLVSSSGKSVGPAPATFITQGLTAEKFIMDCIMNRYQLPPAVEQVQGKEGSKRRSDAKKVLEAFKAMANPSETAIFLNPKSVHGIVKENVKQARCLLARARTRAPRAARTPPTTLPTELSLLARS